MESKDIKVEGESSLNEQYDQAVESFAPVEYTPTISDSAPSGSGTPHVATVILKDASPQGVSLTSIFGPITQGEQERNAMQPVQRKPSLSMSSVPTVSSADLAKATLQSGLINQPQYAYGTQQTQPQYQTQQVQQPQQPIYSQAQVPQTYAPQYQQQQQQQQQQQAFQQYYNPSPAQTYVQMPVQQAQQPVQPVQQTPVYSLTNSMQNMSIGNPMVSYNQPASTFNNMGTDKRGDEVFRPPQGLNFMLAYDNIVAVFNSDGKLSITPEGIIDVIDMPGSLGDPSDGYRYYVERTLHSPPRCTLTCDIEKDISLKVKNAPTEKLYTIRTGLKWETGACVTTYYLANCIIKYLPEDKQIIRPVPGSRDVGYFVTYALIGIPIEFFEWMRACGERMGMRIYKGPKDVEVDRYIFSNFNVSKGKHIGLSYNGMKDGKEQTVDQSSEPTAIIGHMNNLRTNMVCDIYAEFNIKREGRDANKQIKYCLSPSIKHVHIIRPTNIDPPTPNVEAKFMARAGTRIDPSIANLMLTTAQTRNNTRSAIDMVNRGGTQARPGYHAVPSIPQQPSQSANPYMQQGYGHQPGQQYNRPS